MKRPCSNESLKCRCRCCSCRLHTQGGQTWNEMCEDWCLLLSTLSKWWTAERGRKNSCLTLFKTITAQTDLGCSFLCCMYMPLWMHAPLRVYKPVWRTGSCPAGGTDACGTWVLGFTFWSSLWGSNCSEPFSHPSSPGFTVLKGIQFLVAVVTYFNHFQSLCSKMNSGPRRHGFCPEIYHLWVGKQLFWDGRWERSGWVFFLWLLFVCLFAFLME